MQGWWLSLFSGEIMTLLIQPDRTGLQFPPGSLPPVQYDSLKLHQYCTQVLEICYCNMIHAKQPQTGMK